MHSIVLQYLPSSKDTCSLLRLRAIQQSQHWRRPHQRRLEQMPAQPAAGRAHPPWRYPATPIFQGPEQRLRRPGISRERKPLQMQQRKQYRQQRTRQVWMIFLSNNIRWKSSNNIQDETDIVDYIQVYTT